MDAYALMMVSSKPPKRWRIMYYTLPSMRIPLPLMRGVVVLSARMAMPVATPLWAKCEGEAHTPKSANFESSGTPENSELELKGQNTLHWGVLGVIGKGLEV
jgi:hypothetical protein